MNALLCFAVSAVSANMPILTQTPCAAQHPAETNQPAGVNPRGFA
jgi:hypothetical protein